MLRSVPLRRCFRVVTPSAANRRNSAQKRSAEPRSSAFPHGVLAWNNYVDDLARGLANVVTFVNPELIALGGGVAGAGNFLLEAVRPKVDELTTVAPRRRTQIVIATLGNDAGAIGAATMARRGGLTAQESELQHA